MCIPANHPAIATLESFFAAMNSWGAEMIEYYSALRGRSVDMEALRRDQAEQRRKLEAIFVEYCEAGLNAKRLRDTGMSFDLDTPDYDPAHEPIVAVSESRGRFVIETKQTHKLEWNFKYELTQVDGRCKLRDSKKRRSDKDAAWRPDML
jgi:hypothetical protein